MNDHTTQALHKLHEKITIPGNLGTHPRWTWCRPCGQPWPCPTIQTLGNTQ